MKDSRLMICTALVLTLGGCSSSKNNIDQLGLESLPSYTNDLVANTVFADLKSRLSSSGSYIFNPNSEEFICAAKLVDRQILSDAQELLDYKIDPASHRVFLSVTGRKNFVFANVRIIKPGKHNGYFEPLDGLEYQIKDGCNSILSVRRDDY